MNKLPEITISLSTLRFIYKYGKKLWIHVKGKVLYGKKPSR